MIRKLLFCVIALVVAVSASAKGVYSSKEEFLAKNFSIVPLSKALWLKKAQKSTLEKMLGHPVGLRSRYWVDGEKTAWVFEEIGKDLPITIGVVIEQSHITDVTILVFRESRGGEVRYPFFTDQFKGVGLKKDLKLDAHIDGITGATLSYRAVKRSSRAALYLHQELFNESE